MGTQVTRSRSVVRRFAVTRLAVPVVLVALVASACTSGPGKDSGTKGPSGSGTGAGSSAAPSTSATPQPPATLAASPAAAASAHMDPTLPIKVVATGGTITEAKLVNPQGTVVTGKMSSDATSWSSSEVLGYGKTYTLTATAKNADGKTVSLKRSFTTVTPDNFTMPYFQYTGGYALKNGATYGVGIVPVVHFDEPIADKKAATATLSVSSSPTKVTGAWYWSDDQNVAFRPQNYWPAHTRVWVSAKVYGKQVGPGLYGQADASASFTIGDKHVTIADDNAPAVNKVRVYFNDKLVQTYNTSMGKHQTIQVNGKSISYYTMNGTYTVIAHENPARMTSASYGLPVNAPGGYDELIYWATKISTDGIYLHQLNTTIWAQDNGYDVSHGCLNLPTAAAQWFFQHSLIGDVVVVHGTKGAPNIEYWQGGAWSVPWSTWSAGGYNN